MSLYHAPDKFDGAISRNFQFTDIVNLAVQFFKKNPIVILPIIFLLGYWPYVAFYTKNPFTPYFLGGIFIYILYVGLVLWGCLTYQKSHLTKISSILLLLAVFRFAQLVTFDLNFFEFWPETISQILYVTNSLGRISFNRYENYSYLILTALGVLLLEISAIIFVVKNNHAIAIGSGAKQAQFFSSNRPTLLLLGLGFVALTPVTLVKMNIIGYEYQIKYLGTKTGHIKVSAIGGVSSYYCRMSIALSPRYTEKLDSVDVTISGRSSDDSELFKETKSISLKNYDYVDFSTSQYNCNNLAKFTITNFSNFKGLNISADDAEIRSKYIAYSMDEKYNQYTFLAEKFLKK